MDSTSNPDACYVSIILLSINQIDLIEAFFALQGTSQQGVIPSAELLKTNPAKYLADSEAIFKGLTGEAGKLRGMALIHGIGCASRRIQLEISSKEGEYEDERLDEIHLSSILFNC